jgi:hypothetical protein
MTIENNKSMTVPGQLKAPTDTGLSYFEVTILSRRGLDEPGELLRGIP